MSVPTENVKKLFLIIALAVGGSVLCIAFLFVIENSWARRIINSMIDYRKAIGYFVLFLVCLKIIIWLKKSKDGHLLKKRFYVLLSIPVVVYIISACFVAFMPSPYVRCDFYNNPETLNAGVKVISGKTYKIHICGTGGRPQDGTDDELELQLLSDENELLARRHFSVNWEAGKSFHEPLRYTNDSIIYDDSNEGEGSISIPPTKSDWIFSRIPFLY